MIQSISRALDLLELLKRPQRTFSIAQLSSDIGLPPSTVHRLLQTLCEKGFVYRDEQTHLYQLGPALISLGTAAAQGQDLRQLATPVLQRLAQQALEDAFLIIPSGYRGLVLCQVDGPNNLRVTEKFGYEIDLHCGAIRKALLAGHPDVDGLICSLDIIACGAMRAIADSGRRVPQDVAVIGTDNSVYCDICTPRLTSLNTMVFESGVAIAHKLVDCLEGRSTNKRTMLFTSIVERESV